MIKKCCITVLLLIHSQAITLAANNTETLIETMINTSIDTSVQPCQNFFDYACGNFNKTQLFNITESSLPDNALHQYSSEILNLLETFERQQSQMVFEKLRNYFESCRRETNRNVTKYLDILRPGPEIDWPLLEELVNDSNRRQQWPDGKDIDVWSVLGRLQSYGVNNVIVRKDVNVDEFKGITITLEPFPWLTLTEREMESILSVMGVQNTSTKAINNLRQTSKILENILQNVTKTNETDQKTTIGDLGKLFPNLNWKSFFHESMGKYLPLNTSITIRHPGFFRHLNDNLWLTFEKKELCNYIMIRFLAAFNKDNEVDNMKCVYELRGVFGLAVNFLYYHFIFKAQEKFIKSDIMEIFETEVDMLAKHFQSNDLKLTSNQIKVHMEKLKNIRLFIGSFAENVTQENIEELYSNVPSLDANNYYSNHLIMLRFKTYGRYNGNEDKYLMTKQQNFIYPTISFSAQNDVIILPFTCLVQPIYDPNNSNFSKYSILGFILARKLIILCDLKPLTENRQREVSTPLETFFKCWEKQFSVNPFLGPFTDIAASEVLRKIMTLKFFNLQPVDLKSFWKKYYFLHVAQVFCTSHSLLIDLRRTLSEALNQIAMQSEVFSQAFNCPEGSPLNPSEKCFVY